MHEWIVAMAAAAFVGGIAATLAPEGKMRKIVSLVCGFMTIAVMLTPVKEFNLEDYAGFINEFRIESDEYSLELETADEEEMKIIIEEKTVAYILDKTGIQSKVTAMDVDSSEYPIPWEVELYSTYNIATSRTIESELGIPPDRQTWSER